MDGSQKIILEQEVPKKGRSVGKQMEDYEKIERVSRTSRCGRPLERGYWSVECGSQDALKKPAATVAAVAASGV